MRPFAEGDAEAFAALNADPEVMRFYPETWSARQSGAALIRYQSSFAEGDQCFCAAELKESGEFVGLIGIGKNPEDMRAVLAGRPEVEIGWRFNRRFWGQGLAPEGARAWLDYCWQELHLPEVIAFTYAGNQPSRRVMEKIGMRYDPSGDFRHTRLPPDHRLSAHVLYRISNPDRANPA